MRTNQRAVLGKPPGFQAHLYFYSLVLQREEAFAKTINAVRDGVVSPSAAANYRKDARDQKDE
jgi:hypothetical protein